MYRRLLTEKVFVFRKADHKSEKVRIDKKKLIRSLSLSRKSSISSDFSCVTVLDRERCPDISNSFRTVRNSELDPAVLVADLSYLAKGVYRTISRDSRACPVMD